MQSFSVEVADEVGQRLTRLAAEHGLDVGETLRQAVEELEDYYAVRERLGRPHRRVTDAEAWAGLEREG